MASKTQERLLEELDGLFQGKMTGPIDAAGGVAQSVSETFSQLAEVAAATPAGTDTHGGIPAGTNSNDGASAGSIASTFLESGFGIVPLITGLMGLFGGGSTAPELEKYVMPSAIWFESADTGSGLSASDFDQTGAPRLYGSSVDAARDAGGDAVVTGEGAPPPGGGAPSPQITVNVQAMDAQSFMDYSTQIAQAVRGAMLTLSSLNDVVNEL